MNFAEIIHFWFEETSDSQHWQKNPDFDEEIRDKFLDSYYSVVAGETYPWREIPEGALAEVIILDQFSRNIFRDDPQSFLHDPLALALSQNAIMTGHHKELDRAKRGFLYMPFMHSESRVIHEQAVKIFGDLEWGAGSMEFELKHKAIIDRFGRYAHRNAILGRESTSEEIEFLQQPGSGF